MDMTMYGGQTPHLDLPLGIVTRVDDRFIYVWAKTYGHCELRYPINAHPSIQAGTLVNFHQSQDQRGVQYQRDIYVNKTESWPLKLVNHDLIKFTIKANLVFAPESYEPFQHLLTEECFAIAFSPEFGRISWVQAKNLIFTPGVVYQGSIGRMPLECYSIAEEVQSIWTLWNTRLVKVEQPEVIREVQRQMPWNMEKANTSKPAQHNGFRDRRLVEEEFSDGEEPHQNGSRSTSNNRAGETSSKAHPAAAQKPKSQNVGVVVRVEADHFVLWNIHSSQLVCGRPEEVNEFPQLGTWVSFGCYEDKPIAGKSSITKFVYDVEEIEPLRLSQALEDTVQTKAQIWLDPKEKKEYMEGAFVLAQDEVLGPILCSRDPYLMKQLNQANQEVSIYAIYIEDFLKPSKWYAIAVEKGAEEWCKLSNLPDRVDELACLAFEQRNYTERRVRTNQSEVQNIVRQLNGGRTFGPPPGYNGVVIKGNRFTDVLGLVVAGEDEGRTTVLYTCFGLSRIQAPYPLGVWMRIQMVEEVGEWEEEEEETRAEVSDRRFIVSKFDKIKPPMSTRVIVPAPDNQERILLCFLVHLNDSSNWQNELVGEVRDPKKHITQAVPNKEYLVEVGVVRKRSKVVLNVLKYHGTAASSSDNWVPLKLSYFPSDLGRTCDNAHTLLLDDNFNSDSLGPRTVEQEEVQEEEEQEEENRSTSTLSPQPFDRNHPFLKKSFHQHHQEVQEPEERSESEHSHHFPPNGFVNGSPKKLIATNRLLAQTSPSSVLDSKLEDSSIVMQLSKYQRDSTQEPKRGVGIVVRKSESFALVFSRKYGLALLKLNAFNNAEDFNLMCHLGNWIKAAYVRVADSKELPYKWMCVQNITRNSELPLPTRVINQFVQVELNLCFNEETVGRCVGELSKLRVESDVGGVITSRELYDKYGLHNTEHRMWAIHMQERDECFWKLVFPAEVEDDEDVEVEASFSREDEEVGRTMLFPTTKQDEGVRAYPSEHEDEEVGRVMLFPAAKQNEGTRAYASEHDDEEERFFHPTPSEEEEEEDEEEIVYPKTGQDSPTTSFPAIDLISFLDDFDLGLKKPEEKRKKKRRMVPAISIADLALAELMEIKERNKEEMGCLVEEEGREQAHSPLMICRETVVVAKWKDDWEAVMIDNSSDSFVKLSCPSDNTSNDFVSIPSSFTSSESRESSCEAQQPQSSHILSEFTWPAEWNDKPEEKNCQQNVFEQLRQKGFMDFEGELAELQLDSEQEEGGEEEGGVKRETPSTDGYSSDVDVELVQEEGVRLINFDESSDEEKEASACCGAVSHPNPKQDVSQKPAEIDSEEEEQEEQEDIIFSNTANCSSLLEDSSKFFHSLVANFPQRKESISRAQRYSHHYQHQHQTNAHNNWPTIHLVLVVSAIFVIGYLWWTFGAGLGTPPPIPRSLVLITHT